MAMWSVSTNRTTRTRPFTFNDLLNLQNETLAHEQMGLGPSHHLGALLFAEVDPVVTLGQKQVACIHCRVGVYRSVVDVYRA